MWEIEAARSAGYQPALGKPSSSRPNQHDRLLERQAFQRGSSQHEQAPKAQPGQLLQSPAFDQKVLGATITSCSALAVSPNFFFFVLGCSVFILKTGFLCVACAGLKFSILCRSLTVARITGGQHCTQQAAPSEPCCLTRNSPEKAVTAVEGSYIMLDLWPSFFSEALSLTAESGRAEVAVCHSLDGRVRQS